MASHDDGVSPGRIWYGWQYTKGIINTAVKKGGGKDIKKIALYGVAAVGLSAAAVATIFIPFIPGVLPVICASGAALSSRNTVQKFKLVKNHPKFSQFIKDKEKIWLAGQSRASFFGRAKAFGKRSFGRVSLPFAIAGKWLSFGTASASTALGIAGGLQLGGISVIPASAIGAVGSTATAIGLTAGGGLVAATAVCALAVPVGIGLGLLCHKGAKRLRENFIGHAAASRSTPVLKSRFETAPVAAAEIAPDFNQNAEMTEQRRLIAEERARKRDLAKKNGNKPAF